MVEAFAKDEIGVGHALLLAKLQPQQQEEALPNCYQEQYSGARKSKPILLPVRHLQEWIEHNILLILKEAPFDTKDAELVPAAGSCLDCPKRTGHNKLLFADVRQDACTDPACYSAKVERARAEDHRHQAEDGADQHRLRWQKGGEHVNPAQQVR